MVKVYWLGWLGTKIQLSVDLGGSGGVVKSLDFCLVSLKSLDCFWCILSSQWKAVTMYLQILHCQVQRHFWRLVRVVVRMCLATSSNLLLVIYDAPKRIFAPMKLRSSGQPKNDAKTFFSPTLHPLSLIIFTTATVAAFVLLCNSRFNFHCYYC